MIKRKTVLEFNKIKQLFTENEEAYLNEVIRDSKFLERILLNSESLYTKLKNIADNDKKIDQKTRKSLIKYLLRMAGRPQPNTLNSGICLNQPLKFNEKKEIKTVEVSLEWEKNLIKKVEDSLLKSPDISLVLNPKLYKKDKQYILEKSMINSTSYIYIDDSEFLYELFDSLKNPTPLQHILDKYTEDSDKESVLGIIQNLVKADVVKTELSSYSINRDSNAFIEKLKQVCSHDINLISDLEDIQCTLELYRNADIGEGIQLYKDLINKMSSLCKSKSYVIVDLYIYDDMDEKEEIIAQFDIEDSLQIMNYFDKSQGYDWERYYNTFVGKYGHYTRVPLLQMIDKDKGIGLPQHLQSDDKNKKIEQYIVNRIMQSHLKNERKLKLTQTDYANIKEIYGNEGGNRIPISYDCKMVPTGEQLLLPPNAFSFPRYSFTGRFPLLKNEATTQSNYSEINYVGNYFKDVALTYRSESSTFIDCIGQTNTSVNRVPLNEIDLIAQDERLYMVYKNEVIYPVSTHLLSYRNFYEHPALIFLNEYYRYCFEYPSNFPVDDFSYLEFIPRVEYKNLILSPARVNIKFDQESTTEERVNKINELINKYSLNQYKYVYSLEGDRTLPVPTNNSLAAQFLETCKIKMENGYSLVLLEAPELENTEDEVSDWIFSSGHKMFSSEELNGHLKRTLEVSKTFLDEADPNVSSYFLYYRNGKREKIERTILKLKEQLFLEDLFIVNFVDETNKEHIRLRFKKDTIKDIELEKRLSDMLTSGDLYDFKKTLFYPEINRYGGEETFKLAYKLFATDTSSIATFKNLYANYNDSGKALYLSSYMLLSLLSSDLDLLYDYLENSIKKDLTSVKNFAKKRNEYRDIVLRALQDYRDCSNPLLLQHKSLSNEILKASKKAGLSKEELFYLVRSIIHMSMNRHFPFKRDLEDKTNQFMRFAFSNISYYLGRVG